MDDLEFREIQFASADYRAMLSLRDDVLRKPLNLKLTSKDTEGEDNQFHFGLFDSEGKLVASAIAKTLSDREVKIRQVAVSDDYQGKGLGLKLILGVEQSMLARGYGQFQLNSRCHVSKFYEKADYCSSGEEFIESGIPHIKMTKSYF